MGSHTCKSNTMAIWSFGRGVLVGGFGVALLSASRCVRSSTVIAVVSSIVCFVIRRESRNRTILILGVGFKYEERVSHETRTLKAHAVVERKDTANSGR